MRPTKFKTEYNQMLIDHMEKGLSFESFAAVIDVAEETLHDWSRAGNEEKYPGFSESKKKAFSKCRLFWEKLGIEYIINTTETEGSGRDKTTTTKSINTGIYVINMKNRFKWTDRVEHSVDEEKKTILLKYNLEEKPEEIESGETKDVTEIKKDT